MNYFSRQRLPWMLLGMLLVLNLLLLIWNWTGPHLGGPPPTPDDYLMEALSLDAEQARQFEAERESHFQSVRGLQERGREARDKLHVLLTVASPDPGEVDRLAEAIGEVQTEIEEATFTHFRELRGHLRPDQQGEYDKVIGQVLRRGFEKR